MESGADKAALGRTENLVTAIRLALNIKSIHYVTATQHKENERSFQINKPSSGDMSNGFPIAATKPHQRSEVAPDLEVRWLRYLRETGIAAP
jgi:hypothetical protein